MAKVDTRTMNGDRQRCLNIDYPVGFMRNNGRMANTTEDVKLIQAMLRFIKKYDPSNPFSRAISSGDLPSVNGIFDNLTLKAINIYQKANAQILLKVDGLIEPALYQNRNIDTVHKRYRVMTIHALDVDCSTAAILYPPVAGQSWSNSGGGGAGKSINFDSHIEAMANDFPQLTFLRP